MPKPPRDRMNQSNHLRIETVRSARQRADFYRVRKGLYANDPSAVIPLRRMEWAFLDPAVHPFYGHARREVFVAYRGNRPVGRIAAIVDDLHNEHYQDKVGFFGFFETPPEPEVAELLLNTASDYLIAQGREHVRGPMNPSMKGEFGVLVEGHDFTPRIMMAHTPKYYADLLEQFGFEVIKRFFAYSYDIIGDTNWDYNYGRICEISDRICARFPDLRIEAATHANVEERLLEINTIGNHIRSVGWGFVPMTDDELAYMVRQLRRVIDPRAVVSAYYQDQLVGYVVTAPDVNWAIKRAKGPADWIRMIQLPRLLKKIRQCRLIAIGTHPDFRRKGIMTVLTRKMFDLAANDYKHWEFGWIAEDNLSSIGALASSVALDRYRVYHVYQRAL